MTSVVYPHFLGGIKKQFVLALLNAIFGSPPLEDLIG
jgi:hypothetical protein